MRMLFIGDQEKAKIAQALAKAKAKPVLWEQVKDIAIDGTYILDSLAIFD